jgi:hypothetical protein
MSHRFGGWIALAGLAGLLVAAGSARAISQDALGFERTPPRLSFVDGEVSFFRPGAKDWGPASVNTALAAGDELYAAEAANLEIQIASRAYVRAGENTQLSLGSLEPDFIQLRVTEGHVSLDLRAVKASQTLEIDTPNAAFTIERSGYYRVEVTKDTTTFITRRGGRASVMPASGVPAALAASEQVVISGLDAPVLETYAAPALDAWDRWNYARTDDQLDAVSARYVPAGVYGVDELDRAGTWRVVPTYGPIWVPRGVAAGWTPYSTGRWMYDSYYGWTWVDAAPWGWAPYHYGRWVHVSGYWGWAPGPVVVRPYYAPALVAFFGGGGLSIGFSLGGPQVGWVALGWGEPIVPWWGRAGVRGVPRWAGWAGPRVVNNVTINRKTVVHAHDIRDYRNTRVRNAFVAVDRKHFGRHPVAKSRIAAARADKFTPARGDLDLRPGRQSLDAGAAGRVGSGLRGAPREGGPEGRGRARPGEARHGACSRPRPPHRAAAVQHAHAGRRASTLRNPRRGRARDTTGAAALPARAHPGQGAAGDRGEASRTRRSRGLAPRAREGNPRAIDVTGAPRKARQSRLPRAHAARGTKGRQAPAQRGGSAQRRPAFGPRQASLKPPETRPDRARDGNHGDGRGVGRRYGMRESALRTCARPGSAANLAASRTRSSSCRPAARIARTRG